LPTGFSKPHQIQAHKKCCVPHRGAHDSPGVQRPLVVRPPPPPVVAKTSSFELFSFTSFPRQDQNQQQSNLLSRLSAAIQHQNYIAAQPGQRPGTAAEATPIPVSLQGGSTTNDPAALLEKSQSQLAQVLAEKDTWSQEKKALENQIAAYAGNLQVLRNGGATQGEKANSEAAAGKLKAAEEEIQKLKEQVEKATAPALPAGGAMIPASTDPHWHHLVVNKSGPHYKLVVTPRTDLGKLALLFLQKNLISSPRKRRDNLHLTITLTS
jgi:hypothetical protein